jgi:hypothetical protein
METLFQFFDDVDDLIFATAFRMQRALSWQPKERRKVPRTRLAIPPGQQLILAESGQAELRF